MTTKPWRNPPSKEYKPRNPAITSAMMAQVRGRENKAEVALRKALWQRGLRYRLYASGLMGRPDMVFGGPRVVVFVDGDYWHGRAIIEQGSEAFRATMRTERRDWWVAKITRNVERDREVTKALQGLGWRVLRVWESAVKENPERIAARLAKQITTARNRKAATHKRKRVTARSRR